MKKRIVSLVCLLLTVCMLLAWPVSAAGTALIPVRVSGYNVMVLTPSNLLIMNRASLLEQFSDKQLNALGGKDSKFFPQLYFQNADATVTGNLILVKNEGAADFDTLTDEQLKKAVLKLSNVFTQEVGHDASSVYAGLSDPTAADITFLSSSDLRFVHISISGQLDGKDIRQEQYITVKDGLTLTLTFTMASYMEAEGSAVARTTAEGIRVTSSGFADMAGHWADGAAARAVEAGLFKGTSTAMFSPDRTISRAELVTVLYRSYESRTGSKDENEACTLAFTDVACDSWYLSAVNWAAENGIVKGSNHQFRPNDPVTREELTAILYRFDALLKGKSADTDARTLASAASDAALVSSWAIGSMNWALKNKYLTGMNGLLSPKSGTTRAQAAAILVRYLGV